MGVLVPVLRDVGIFLDHVVGHGLGIIEEGSWMRILLIGIMLGCLLLASILSIYVLVSKFIEKHRL